MYRHKFIPALFVLTALVTACGRHPAAPTSPTSATPTTANADDPITLKASAPRVVSPVNDVLIQTATPVLTIQRATATFDSSAIFEYRFQLLDAAGTILWDSGALSD